jgi:acyl carrier protein
LPLTHNGKVDKRALPEAVMPQFGERTYIAPGNAVEKKLAEIWKRILHLEQVGVQDNFFELGGHSLLAMRLIAAIRKELQAEVTIKELFQFNTIENLSRYVAVQTTVNSEEQDLSKFEILNI